MLKQIKIGYIRSYGDVQSLDLALPNGTQGSGYNVIVGKNNTGKSTLVKSIKDLCSGHNTIIISQEARHDQSKPFININWTNDNSSTNQIITIETDTNGGHFKIEKGLVDIAKLRYIPSRRQFSSEFHDFNIPNHFNYEYNYYNSSRNNQAYFDTNLASAIASLFIDKAEKLLFMDLLKRIDNNIYEVYTDNTYGKNVIIFESKSGKKHPISDTGDGIINLIRVIYTLQTAEEGSIIIIDEPEISLHPQLQKNLYNLLHEYSAKQQIIVVTHSPYFISWKHLQNNGKVIRIAFNANGHSQIKSASTKTLQEIGNIAEQDIKNRKLYDAVCKELFFCDEALLVEGPEDVHFISNYLEIENQPPLPIVGYGCGGADSIKHWINLCKELGIKAAALFDGDKKALVQEINQQERDKGQAKAFLLDKCDIRDKSDKKIDGIFDKDGSIKEENKENFDNLIKEIRDFLV